MGSNLGSEEDYPDYFRGTPESGAAPELRQRPLPSTSLPFHHSSISKQTSMVTAVQDVTPCSRVDIYKRFGRICWLYLEIRRRRERVPLKRW
jgi:hypothetical protein